MTTVEIRAGLSRDHLVTVGQPPHYFQPGGPGVYASLGAAIAAREVHVRGHQGVSVSLRASIDEGDADLRDLLTQAGVDLSACSVGPIPTLWILNAPEGRRVLATRAPDGSHELDESEAVSQDGVIEDASDADFVLLSSPARALPSTHPGQVVVVDPDQREIAERGWDYITELAQTTDVFLPSRVQLTQLGTDVEHVALEWRRRTGRSVVARLDAEGSLVLPMRGRAWALRTPEVSVVDTTGAGDSQAGALVGALASIGASVLDSRALVNAAVVATAVVAHTLSAPGPAGLSAVQQIPDGELQAVRVTERELP